MSDPLRAPFPYFGGKAAIAAAVWARLGDVPNYVEPFFGSGAMLLARPHAPGIETVNDADGFVANFWRALQADPDAVAHHADWPVIECDLHARHAWLVGQRASLTARLEGDPAFYDARVAGWWLWGICAWIGNGWCAGVGPWQVVGGELVRLGDAGRGINRNLVHLGNAGRGINRNLVHLGDAGRGINRQRVHLGDAGSGINRKRVHLGNSGRGVNRKREDAGTCADQSAHLRAMLEELADRMRRVRVCSGDWSRVCGRTPTVKQGLTGVFLDPPYSDAERRPGLYALDSGAVAADVRAWAIDCGDDPRLRIALCGYLGEHDMPAGWSALRWKARGGYGSQGEGAGRVNAAREIVWFSPHCLRPSEARQTALPLAVPT